MRCWSCNKHIPEDAKFCPHCEAQAESESTDEEKAVVADILGAFSPAWEDMDWDDDWDDVDD